MTLYLRDETKLEEREREGEREGEGEGEGEGERERERFSMKTILYRRRKGESPELLPNVRAAYLYICPQRIASMYASTM